MANHSKHARSSTFAMPSKSSLVKIAATVAAVGLLATGGIVSRNLYTSAEQNTANQVTAFSVTDSAEASRGNARELLNGDTSYVTVKINGKSRVVPGTNFTDVKSVLDAGDITLEPEDTVSPSLTTKVDEKTVITVQRAGASVEVSDTAIGFNVVKKETSSLPEGQEKVEREGNHEPRNQVRRHRGLLQYDQLVCEEGSGRQGHSRRHRLHFVVVLQRFRVDRHHCAGGRNAAVGSRLSAVERLHRSRFHRHRIHHHPRVRLERHRNESEFGRLWSAPGVAWQQDGERGRRLGHQLSDSAQVVLGLLRAALWFHSGSLHVLAGQSLLLNRD